MASSSSPRTPTAYLPMLATQPSQSSDDLDSDSDSSQITTFSVAKPPPYPRQPGRPPPTESGDVSHNAPRPPNPRVITEPPSRSNSRTNSPTVEASSAAHLGHRPRQRSQGYFEPTLSSSNVPPAMSNNLTASQIAAQAAMHLQNSQHTRKRSTTVPQPDGVGSPRQQASPPPVHGQITFKTNGITYQNGIVGGHRMAATTAANVVFPKSPLHSPGLGPEGGSSAYSPVETKPVKEKSKMKLPFTKPKGISTSKEKDFDKKNAALPSPNKMAMHSTTTLNRLILNSASTTSLADSTMSGNSALYSSANASTSTLVPMDRAATYVIPEKEKEKERHKHNFLSRQKHKLKDEHHLPLSSANSNSKPTDPNAPQPLYSFAAPSSPGHANTFAQSVTGLDLRHAGRGLRQKKKEERAASLAPYMAESESTFRDRSNSFSTDRSEWTMTTVNGPSPGVAIGPSPASELAGLGASFGLPGLTQDDAWPLLKARLLHIFEGEDPRPPIEDFNALVSVHIRRCIQKRAPDVLIGDLTELLQTGFLSLDQTLRHVPDERLVPHLVEMWLVVFTTILPFLQAVFLPLDLEFKGRGPLLSAREAAEFWGAALPDSEQAAANANIPTLGEDLDVRRITLLTFRDTVILPRHDTLTAIFSRLSLENLSAGLVGDHFPTTITTSDPNSLVRPSTSASMSDPAMGFGSFNSTSSGLLDGSTPSSSLPSNSRSRATSNTSAGSFHSIGPHPHAPQQSLPRQFLPTPLDSSRVTETVGRMLQCVSVLASVQSGDESQAKMERLTKELKYNWLGRGRTGRQRRGFVGARLPRTGLGVGTGGGTSVAVGGGGG